MEYTALMNEQYEQQFGVIIEEAKKAVHQDVVPGRSYLDYLQLGCDAALSCVVDGDLTTMRMVISRAMRAKP